MQMLPDGRMRNPMGCEINAAMHCNLRCRACSHMSPVLPPTFADPDGVERDLTALATVYSANYVKVLGGEPLLHPQLPELLHGIRRSGVSDFIRLTTNGVLLDSRHPEVWDLVEEIEISLYPGRSISNAQLDGMWKRADEHGVRLRPTLMPMFRESFSEQGTDDGALIDRIFRTCQVIQVWRCHTVLDGYFYVCPQAYFHHAMPGGDGQTTVDGIPISTGPEFGQRLWDYLHAPTGPQACRTCLGTVGKAIAHEQVPLPRWREPQQRTSESMVDTELMATLEQDITFDSFNNHELQPGELIPEDWQAQQRRPAAAR